MQARDYKPPTEKFSAPSESANPPELGSNFTHAPPARSPSPPPAADITSPKPKKVWKEKYKPAANITSSTKPKKVWKEKYKPESEPTPTIPASDDGDFYKLPPKIEP